MAPSSQLGRLLRVLFALLALTCASAAARELRSAPDARIEQVLVRREIADAPQPRRPATPIRTFPGANHRLAAAPAQPPSRASPLFLLHRALLR